MLQNQAMLMNLSVSRWTARKFDRKATQAVDQANGAKDAGRYNKLLIDGDALKPINSAEAALRETHYRMTLPWGDNGDRLLPSRLYFEYTKKMRDAKLAFENAVNAFLPSYPQLMQDARRRLGALYDPADYPPASHIRDKFAVRIEPAPVPDANDFRVDVGNENAATIRAEITASVAARQAEAIKDCYARVREVCERYSTTLRKAEPRIFETMIDNARDLVTLLPALNIADDPTLTEIVREIELMSKAGAGLLRTSHRTRLLCADQAEAVLRRLPA